jgi:nitrilase
MLDRAATLAGPRGLLTSTIATFPMARSHDAHRSDTVAVAQASPVAFDPEATLQRVASLTTEAADRGAQLIVFPEALFPCYPKGADFGTRVGQRSADGRSAFRRYFDHAVERDGPVATRLGQLARGHAMAMVVGVVERVGTTLYCSAFIFAPDGTLAGIHRKVMPTAMERVIWGFGDGSTLPVVQMPVGRVGAVICWENYMPLLRTAMYAQGIQLYCAPTVDDRDSWVPTMQHIALEGRCFVLSACQYVTRAQYPTDYQCAQGDKGDTVLIRGGSLIVNPLGRLLAGPVYDRECVLVADIDLGEIAEGKFDLDVVGHYARPDIFHLRVDTAAHPPVTAAEEG